MNILNQINCKTLLTLLCYSEFNESYKQLIKKNKKNLIAIIFCIVFVNQKYNYDIESKISTVVEMEKIFCPPGRQFRAAGLSQLEIILSCEGGPSGHLNR